MDKTKIYFVSTDTKVENETIKKVKPEGILQSYYYFKNKSIKKWIEKIGYKPDIILDSGAFSAWSKNEEIDLQNYMKYIKENINFIEYFVVLDEIGNPEKTYENYKIMKNNNLNPKPVFHYGSKRKWLEKYIKEENENFILLGGVAKMNKNKLIKNWVNRLCYKYNNVKFHLLGKTNHNIINNCPIYSSDSSAYIMGAVFGNPKHIKGNDLKDKVKRAVYNMKKTLRKNKKNKPYQIQQSLFPEVD